MLYIWPDRQSFYLNHFSNPLHSNLGLKVKNKKERKKENQSLTGKSKKDKAKK